MSKISCCGKNCYECVNFPHDCVGCDENQGRVFWLEFVDEVICPIYNCCVNKEKLPDCGLCPKHRCERYSDEGDAVTSAVVDQNSGFSVLENSSVSFAPLLPPATQNPAESALKLNEND